LNYQHCGVLALKENGKQRSFMQVFEGYTLKALNVPMQTSYSFCFTYLIDKQNYEIPTKRFLPQNIFFVYLRMF